MKSLCIKFVSILICGLAIGPLVQADHDELVNKYKDLFAGKTTLELEIKNGEEAAALAEVLKNDEGLEELSLIGRLDMEKSNLFAESLAEALKYNKKLKKLLIYDINGDLAMEAIAKALPSNQTLETLRLGHAGVPGAKALAEAIKLNRTLKDLSLDLGSEEINEMSKESEYMNEAAIEALLEGLKLNASLTHVDVFDTEGYSKHFLTIYEIGKRNKKIAKLWQKVKLFASKLPSNFDVLPPEVKLQILEKLWDSYSSK